METEPAWPAPFLLVYPMTLLMNERHLFYGLSMLEPYRGMGWKKICLIFGMADETFSINCAVDALRLWKRQMLLSIAGGTILYMVPVQTVF